MVATTKAGSMFVATVNINIQKKENYLKERKI